MTVKNYGPSLAKVLVHEGGYSNHPRDPGGATMKGVTQRVYDAYREKRGLKKRSVKNITEQELQAIYKPQYWDAVQGDKLPKGLDYVVFDGAVNSGPKQSIKWLQKALGVAADGVIGVVTLQKITEHKDIDALIDRICDIRLQFLRALRTWNTFGNGWASRVRGVRAIGKAWAVPGQAEPPPAAFMEMGDAKAYIESATPEGTKAPADAAAGVGATLAVVGGGIETARQTLWSYTEINFVNDILPYLAIAGLVIGGLGLAWGWYVRKRNAKLDTDLNLEKV